MENRHLNSHRPLFLLKKTHQTVAIWLQFYTKTLSYSWKRPSKLSALTPLFYRCEHDEWQSWVQNPGLLTLNAAFFPPLPQTKQELGKQFRRSNIGLTCGINVHLFHGICYLQLCSCYGICCSVSWLCAWFAILSHSNMLPQSTEQWSVNFIRLTVICELNCYSST